EIGVTRCEPGKRIDLEHLGAPPLVQAHVDSTCIATAETTPGVERDPLHFVAQAARLEQSVVDQLAPLRFVAIGVHRCIRALPQDHLERRERSRLRSRSQNTYGELPARQEPLDQDGLTVELEQLRARI